MEKSYLKDLELLSALTRLSVDSAAEKVQIWARLYLNYETRVMLPRNLSEHPYLLTQDMVQAAIKEMRAVVPAPSDEKGTHRAEGHKELFQDLWVQYSYADLEKRIVDYVFRIEINELPRLDGKSVIDIGCGHGAVAFAFKRCGAASVFGVDYGAKAIEYANAYAKDRGLGRFETVDTVARLDGIKDESFDFAINNGVFHHLSEADEEAAYREMYRVLKPGGWAWIYTDGSGAIAQDIFDAGRFALQNISQSEVLRVLRSLDLPTGKLYHLSDGLNAVYKHTTPDNLLARLTSYGFGNFRRLRGGLPTDTDGDALASDRWGKEKFGTGDLRYLVQKL